MLYTTYSNKLKQIPEDMRKVFITRFPPKWLKTEKTENQDILKAIDFKNTIVDKRLSPSVSTLLEYKEDEDWDKYVRKFAKEINTKKMQEALNELLEILELKIGFGKYRNYTPTNALLEYGEETVEYLIGCIPVLEKHSDKYKTNTTKILQIKAAVKAYKNGTLQEKPDDVYLICFEKDYFYCHRYLLAQWLISKGIEWKEL